MILQTMVYWFALAFTGQNHYNKTNLKSFIENRGRRRAQVKKALEMEKAKKSEHAREAGNANCDKKHPDMAEAAALANRNVKHAGTERTRENASGLYGDPAQSTDIRQSHAACLATIDQSHAACLAAIRQSRLPKRYKGKLLFDLETIFQISIPGISRIVLFGSCARNELRAGSDLDLLILTLRPVPRELRGELCGILAEEKNGIATDLVFYTEEEFGRSDCRLVREIRKDGRILWESPAELSLGG